jgi:hypothetical protein
MPSRRTWLSWRPERIDRSAKQRASTPEIEEDRLAGLFRADDRDLWETPIERALAAIESGVMKQHEAEHMLGGVTLVGWRKPRTESG